jgi:hypothetical protein
MQKEAKERWYRKFREKWGVGYGDLSRFAMKRLGESFSLKWGDEYTAHVVHLYNVNSRQSVYFDASIDRVKKYIDYHYKDVVWEALEEEEKWLYVHEWKMAGAVKKIGVSGLTDMIKCLMYDLPLCENQMQIYESLKGIEELEDKEDV